MIVGKVRSAMQKCAACGDIEQRVKNTRIMGSKHEELCDECHRVRLSSSGGGNARLAAVPKALNVMTVEQIRKIWELLQ